MSRRTKLKLKNSGILPLLLHALTIYSEITLGSIHKEIECNNGPLQSVRIVGKELSSAEMCVGIGVATASYSYLS
jgi:hypothetical protein